MNKLKLIPLLISTALTGCAAHAQISNHRVVHADLLQPSYTKPIIPKDQKINLDGVHYGARIVFPIEFENESFEFKKQKLSLDKHLKQIKYLSSKYKIDVNIVGHSHGATKHGLRALSTKRANAIYFYLLNKGFKRTQLKRQASWSGQNDGSLQKGVEVVLNIPGQFQPKTIVKK
jgi:outer membrane protein OmpA-like peptidoglycan-associated protein